MAVVKIAKSRGSRDVIGAADEMNGLNQGHLQGQEAVNFNSLSSSERSLKRHWIMAAYSSGLQHGQSTNAFIITVIDHTETSALNFRTLEAGFGIYSDALKLLYVVSISKPLRLMSMLKCVIGLNTLRTYLRWIILIFWSQLNSRQVFISSVIHAV